MSPCQVLSDECRNNVNLNIHLKQNLAEIRQVLFFL